MQVFRLAVLLLVIVSSRMLLAGQNELFLENGPVPLLPPSAPRDVTDSNCKRSKFRHFDLFNTINGLKARAKNMNCSIISSGYDPKAEKCADKFKATDIPALREVRGNEYHATDFGNHSLKGNEAYSCVEINDFYHSAVSAWCAEDDFLSQCNISNLQMNSTEPTSCAQNCPTIEEVIDGKSNKVIAPGGKCFACIADDASTAMCSSMMDAFSTAQADCWYYKSAFSLKTQSSCKVLSCKEVTSLDLRYLGTRNDTHRSTTVTATTSVNVSFSVSGIIAPPTIGLPPIWHYEKTFESSTVTPSVAVDTHIFGGEGEEHYCFPNVDFDCGRKELDHLSFSSPNGWFRCTVTKGFAKIETLPENFGAQVFTHTVGTSIEVQSSELSSDASEWMPTSGRSIATLTRICEAWTHKKREGHESVMEEIKGYPIVKALGTKFESKMRCVDCVYDSQCDKVFANLPLSERKNHVVNCINNKCEVRVKADGSCQEGGTPCALGTSCSKGVCVGLPIATKPKLDVPVEDRKPSRICTDFNGGNTPNRYVFNSQDGKPHLMSPDFWNIMTFGPDGIKVQNGAIYPPENNATWNTPKRDIPGRVLAIQSDGNLVIYDANPRTIDDLFSDPTDTRQWALWYSNTSCGPNFERFKKFKPRNCLEMQNNGNLVMFVMLTDPDNPKLVEKFETWNSSTGKIEPGFCEDGRLSSYMNGAPLPNNLPLSRGISLRD